MKTRYTTPLLMLPGSLYLVGLLVIPGLLIFSYSFMTRGSYGGVVPSFSLENYIRAADYLYLSILLSSLSIASIAVALCLLVGYPAAYAIHKLDKSVQLAALLIVILPFWTNYLIRTYAWILLLNTEGVINAGLVSIGAVEKPIQFLYTRFAVVVGLVHSYLPFVILTVYASLQRLEPSLMEASSDLGASPRQTFTRVILPLTMPGITAGATFVFILSIGNFLTPNLLGGGQTRMIGNLIYDQFMTSRDWPFGAALASILLSILFVLLLIQAKINRKYGG